MQPIWPILFDAAKTPAIDQAIHDLYAQIDVEIQQHNPICEHSGRCCKFDTFGHRLYCTGLEIARFLQQTPSSQIHTNTTATANLSLPMFGQTLEDGCVYQIDGLCSAHHTRPHGCRIFFCQPGSESWQQDLYEKTLTQLRAMHEQWSLPYRYMEWRTGLREACEAMKSSNPQAND